MEKILAFQLEGQNLQKLKQTAAGMKVKLYNVDRKDFYQLIGNLFAQKRNPLLGYYGGTAVSESMIVLEGFSDKRLDILLRALKRDSVSIDFKAVATSANKRWTVLQMYLEMEKERNSYLQMTKNK